MSKNGAISKVPAFPANVVDTTGAGDDLAGGFLYALYEGDMTVCEAARYGSAVAARNCEFPGGVEAKSNNSDIQRKLMEAEIAQS